MLLAHHTDVGAGPGGLSRALLLSYTSTPSTPQLHSQFKGGKGDDAEIPLLGHSDVSSQV